MVFSFMFSDNFFMELVSTGLPKNRSYYSIIFSKKKKVFQVSCQYRKKMNAIIIALRAFNFLQQLFEF